ncbi:YkvA family protein [Lichenicoccus sp.]|uniref:YkvA family protein n=1 Tax=Lichenicoccus sp. TaxID=2781899 RepID=UPI003D14A8C5
MPSALAKLVDPHVCPVCKLLVFGLAYPMLPIDLIPDRLPYIGHVDNYGLPVVGAIAALILMLDILGRTAVFGRLTQGGIRAVLPIGRLVAAATPGQFILRLILGRWPDKQEQQAFLRGLAATSHSLPPLLRAIAYVPAAAPLLSRGMLLSAAGEQAGDRAPGGSPLSDAQMRGNLLTIWRGPKVRFLHFEKTAGSSLVVALQSQFHPLQIHSATALKTIAALEPDRLSCLVAAHRRADLAWGHYDLPSLLCLDGDDPCFRLCLLRDPRQRILSLYYFWKGNLDEPGRHVRLARENDLLAFLRLREPAIRNEIDNLYVRRLTGLYATDAADPLDAGPDQALQAARQAIGTLDFVGLSERLGDSLAVLGAVLGFTPPRRTPKVNVQADLERHALKPVRAIARETITPEIDAELASLTRLDIVLYRSAERRLDQLMQTDCPIRAA